jgi:hypothetical protein
VPSAQIKELSIVIGERLLAGEFTVPEVLGLVRVPG